MTTTAETHSFKTEARQLLDLMIHAVYSNKEIFLRELISNASDALDKRRFLALTEPDAMPAGTQLHILLRADPTARALAVEDNGIGMGRDEVQELIGTIAKSGTKEFSQMLRQHQGEALDAELIGQFGVGFYSVFMVAREVEVITRKVGEDTATRWVSTGDGTYTIEATERETPGTTVTLHLYPADDDEAMPDFTDEWRLRAIVKRYSDFVAYPIEMDVTRTEARRDDDGNEIEGESVEVVKRETLNSMKAIWLRPPGEVTEDEYTEFYKHVAHDWTAPLKRIQAKIEGTLEYRLLLFIPRRAPMDLFQVGGARQGVHLYVKRVFIMDDCKELLPEYLRFLRGVVDSEDLSLNISRELLQQDRQIARMRRGIIGKVLSALEDMRKNEPDNYATFWNEFGRVLKEGIFQDHEQQERLLGLSRFHSTHDEGAQTSLEDYIARMPDSQEAIYYLAGESHEHVRQSPHLEAFRAKGYEVLLLSEPVDEVWTSAVNEYAGKPFQSIGQGDVELGDEAERAESKEAREEQESQLKDVLAKLQACLEEDVKQVRVSPRLTESLACLVGDTGDLSPQLEQMMRAMGQEVPKQKRVLEVNANHPVVTRLHALYQQNPDDPALADYAQLLYGQAVLAEGGELRAPGRFSRLLAELMARAM